MEKRRAKGMKLGFSREGLQFFFVTVVVAGRRELLSTLGGDGTRPALTRLGEIVWAGLNSLHLVNAAWAVSDFIIMPDHFHFVLILDCSRDAAASPLFATHRLLDAIEAAAARLKARDGRGPAPETPGGTVPAPETPAGAARPAAETPAGAARPATTTPGGTVPAPETPAGAAKVAALRPLPLEEYRQLPREEKARLKALMKKRAEFMAGLVREATAARKAAWSAAKAAGLSDAAASEVLAGAVGEAGVSGAQSPSVPVLFERSPWLDLSFDGRQLAAIRHYIRLNPDRALWKRRHPDLFECRRVSLPMTPPAVVSVIGEATLLGSPFKLHARLTLKKTVAEHEPAIADLVEQARRGRVIVSGFLSPGEKELLRRLKAEPKARFVKTLPHALPPRYDPSAEDSREIAAGRLAIVSQVAAPPIPSLAMRRTPAAAHDFRRNCLAMNALAAALCASSL
ncbi:MAG: hypothetical protein MJ138_02440 [Kiritimatiellae bacterium]|nr:hypothetical protein [Kiritimatiellia bacterium]